MSDETRAQLERVAAFRADYRQGTVPPSYDGRAHLAATTALQLGACAVALAFGRGASLVEWMIVPVTFVLANVIEWAGHRWLMHVPRPGLGFLYRRHSGVHHRFFTEHAMAVGSTRDFHAVIFPLQVSLFYLGLVAMPLAFALGALVTPEVGWLFLAAAVAYYELYELLHLLTHLEPRGWLARSAGLAHIRAHHARHHDPRVMRHGNFNITVPLADTLFGTKLGPD
jgi:hypothetical protein